MNRRELLKAGGLGALGLGLSGCSTGAGARLGAPGGLDLHPVRISWDRVIRTTVGLRPHRPAGFRVEAERFDDKTVVHNYGHGGAGMSLSWGTGSLAADLALAHESRRVAVIGCGAAGLTAARELQKRGFVVTIYAKAIPPHTTSNMSWASFTPTSGLLSSGVNNPAWTEQFRRAAGIAYRELQLLVGRGYGVSWIDSYTFSDERTEGGGGGGNSLLPAALRTGSLSLRSGEHPFPSRFARQRPALRIEPSIYLDALLRDFAAFGGRVVVRAFDGPRDFASLSQSLVVNCTGLGARELFRDDTMVPVKGQLTLLVPQPEVRYATLGGVPSRNADGFVHMMPRSDGIALGGTSEEGVWSLEPNEEARQRVMEEHMALFAGMRTA